ncbi:hypothetical protein GHT06_001886 [Daphnia sinensis]|uniref:Uncharacterized protein n=1 Tax=Daphnia sinensis TaxID=1820382 RepID=A0AAD5KDG2_9CRUS|nr:hypothetical protein GHT06_001886 [Daphnia sinensis]
MVNGEDYTNLPFTKFSSIIKSKAVARTSVGVSRGMDLLDPTGKYSSTMVSALDGVIFEKNKDASYLMQTENTNQVISFFTEVLPSIISDYPTQQKYYTNVTRVNFPNDTEISRVKWVQKTVSNPDCTGYFAINNVAVSAGAYSSTDMAYLTSGSLCKVTAPFGYYFSDTNRLVNGTSYGKKTEYWVTIKNVIGDGFNGGDGYFSDNTGAIILSSFVPTGAIVTQVIPVLNNSVSVNILNSALNYITVNRDFSLVYDATIKSVSSRWSVVDYPNSNGMIDFISGGSGNYTVLVRSLSYYFASVNDVRFADPSSTIIYDSKNGQTKKDEIIVSDGGINRSLSVLSKRMESSGYADDFTVEVSGCPPPLHLILIFSLR